MCDIKSSAIVKFSATKNPSRYNELEKNTNINSPPADWLQGRYAKKEPWAPGQIHREREFSSFAMANSYIDHVGKVDVITDAENVKKLLKTNFSKAPVSMMVHRVGRTLLIDSLDVYKHVLFAQEQDWKWLKEFINENIMPPNDSNADAAALLPVSTALSRKDIEENLMLSKFLYHSIDNIRDNEVDGVEENSGGFDSTNVPDPLVSEEDDFQCHNNFERNILWNFEDIRMLIGTDMPIFGGGTHPCVSLRLRDMKKSINVLTGIDYWLDQLMCTVPEVVMCYHLNGIVQRYEVVKTEDLPNLPDGSFSPELVRDVAQNILSFLKSNATKEGHTYWLFKGKDDDIVKLYDLTSVCKEYECEKDANPFTLPVAVLLYRVAKNLIQKYVNNANARKMSGTIYRLLTHCLDLLDAEKFPQVVGSVHYLLANLYITYGKPVDADEKQENTNAKENDDIKDFDDSFDQNDWYVEDPSKKSDFNNFDEEGVARVTLKNLADPATLMTKNAEDQQQTNANSKAKLIPNCSNLEDCWTTALEHVLKGLDCVKAFALGEEPKVSSEKGADEVQANANPNEPIPLQYEPIKAAAKLLPLAVRFPNATGWRLELTSLLLVKAISAYRLLSDCANKLQNYGKALRYVKLGLLCFESAMKLTDSSTPSLTLMQCRRAAEEVLPSLFVLCGDIHLVLSHQKAVFMAKHIRDYNSQMYRDERIAHYARRVLGDESNFEFSWCAPLSESIEQNLHLSVKCYEKACSLMRSAVSALENCSKKKDQSASPTSKANEPETKAFQSIVLDAVMISKLLGNVKNELGVYYMNLSTALLAKNSDTESIEGMKKVENCWHMSYSNFQEGIQIFNKINDKGNEALLNSNAGRLMRLCANAYVEEGKEFSEQEQHYLVRAIEMYQRAFECISQRSDEHHIWEAVAWELSSVYFAYATHLQDRPPLSRRTDDDVEKEIVDLMQKSLRIVDSLDFADSPKHAVYLYRSSIIHHKLASLYHRNYRAKEQLTDRKAKQIRSLTELHYQKASEGFKEILSDCPVDFIRLQLERVALIEFNLENAQNVNAKLKLCQQALEMILSCRSAYVGLCIKYSPENAATALQMLNGKEVDDSDDEESRMNEETLNDTSPKKSKSRAAVEESQTKEWHVLADITVKRLQHLTKTGLMLIKSGNNKENEMKVWKTAYAATLVKKPIDSSNLLSFVMHIMEKVNDLCLL